MFVVEIQISFLLKTKKIYFISFLLFIAQEKNLESNPFKLGQRAIQDKKSMLCSLARRSGSFENPITVFKSIFDAPDQLFAAARPPQVSPRVGINLHSNIGRLLVWNWPFARKAPLVMQADKKVIPRAWCKTCSWFRFSQLCALTLPEVEIAVRNHQTCGAVPRGAAEGSEGRGFETDRRRCCKFAEEDYEGETEV